ncbi:coenzyme F420 hydrogenase [bacterium]|nr:MAG: coenzyme F420 hydrogenase [bacterium]
MSGKLKIKGDPNDSIRGFLRHLLESGKIDGVFALGKTGKGLNYLLVTDKEKVDELYPLFPFMPENAANLLSRLTFSGPLPGKIAVVIKPCELRAFVELVKREQASRDNLVFISPVCGGVLDFVQYKNDALEKSVPGYMKSFAKRENAENIRPTCRACEYFIPINADITVIPAEEACEFYLNTDKAGEITKGAPGDLSDGELDEAAFEPLMGSRKAEKEKLFEELKLEDYGIKGLVEVFGKCLGCHGCMSVCPICYCALCAFESKDNEFTPPVFESELTKRGGLRVPPNTIFYHLGRITHMGISCVGCGMCSDVCPVDIPVSSIFLRSGDAVQKVFDYLPGKDIEEPVPLSTFIEDELTEVED